MKAAKDDNVHAENGGVVGYDIAHNIDDGNDNPPFSSSSSSSSGGEFVNTGLRRWEEIRHEWLSSSSSKSSSPSPPSSSRGDEKSPPSMTGRRAHHAKDVDIDEVIDLIVSNRWRQTTHPHPTPSPVPPPPPSRASSGSSISDAATAEALAAAAAAAANRRREENARFPNPVSLPQIVDVLVDLWEAEGLDI
jgi:hypothetical protein